MLLSLPQACAILQQGGVVAIPTDTCYGLAADAKRREAVARVLAIKGRASSRPPAVFVPDLPTIHLLAHVPPHAQAFLEAHLPGPYTVLLPPSSSCPPWLVSPEGLVGIRLVAFPTVVDLLSLSGLTLTATSANFTGSPVAYDLDGLSRVLSLDLVDGVVEGACGGLPPSTVVDLSTPEATVRRLGSSPGEEKA